jgi:hypothetical protein
MPLHPLTAFGLILGMIGVAVIFLWGPPQPSFQEHVVRTVMNATPMPNGRTAQQHADDARRTRVFYGRMSRFGLILIFVGFLLQLIDAWRN